VKHLHHFLAPAGVVLLLFGLVSYALTLRFDPWTAIHLIGGALLIAASISLNLTGFRRTVVERGTREHAQAVTGAVLFGAILVTANVLAARHPWRYDATENKIHTLTDKTKALLTHLQVPVQLVAFLEAGDPMRKDLEDLLSRYAALSSQLTWRFVDAEKEPQIADQMGVRRQGVVVARAGATTAQASPDGQEPLTEGAITNAILKVTRPGPKVIYELTGHGEPDLEDVRDAAGLGLLSEALRAENFDVRPLLLSAKPTVPEDAALVLVAGPRKPLLVHEREELRAYLARGGRLLVLLDPALDAGLGDLLSDYRIRVDDDMIVDQQEIPFLGARLGLDPIIEEFLPHPVTRAFKERIVLLQARSVDVALKGGLPGAEAHALAETSAAAWAERSYREMLATGRVARDPEDRQGPISVAAAASIEPSPQGAPGGSAPPRKGEGSRLVVVGDSDFLLNGNLDAYFNREFCLNAVEWLAGRDELIAEGPRGLRPSRLDMTETDFRTLFRLGVLLLPESLLILGLGIRWRRRSL